MASSEQSGYPTSVEDIFADYQMRKGGILKALTDDAEELFAACNPEAENLCLYGLRDGSWQVGPPAEEVPPELPEPCLGINFARDGMPRKEWLALLAVHADTWLLSVAFYYGVKLQAADRLRLFKLINGSGATLFEVVTERKVPATSKVITAGEGPSKRPRMDRPHSSPYHTGRMLMEADVTLNLVGRSAELYWPDDQKWYLVEIQSVNVKGKRAKIVYASGEFEDVDLAEILRDGHMALL